MNDSLDEIISTLPGAEQKLTTTYQETWDDLRHRITVLSDRAWESRITWPVVERWLANFKGHSGHTPEDERLHALYILSQFLYFGGTEIRALLRAIYTDLFYAPLVQRVRDRAGGTRELPAIRRGVDDALRKTRFLGIGNPSESGVHLLYYFRQENHLSKEHFIDAVSILQKPPGPQHSAARSLRQPHVDRYIFVDDVCGSGETAVQYSHDFLAEVKSLRPDIELCYFAIFSTAEGMKRVREQSLFGNNAQAIYELDGSYRCLSEHSRYLRVVPPHVAPETLRKVALHYGSLLLPGHPGGYEDSQMLLGFHHNTPDNTLPIIWMDRTHGASIAWEPAFRRYPKMTGASL